MQKLQRLQNCAARLACKVNHFDKVRSEELLKKLHWLKIREKVVYKVLLTVHKCVYGEAPLDLKDMIILSRSNRTKKVEIENVMAAWVTEDFQSVVHNYGMLCQPNYVNWRM